MTTNNEPQQKPPIAASINHYFPAINHFFLVFNEVLLSNTRPSQRPTAGVLMHIEDAPEGVQPSCRRKKPLKMQNEPNLNISKFTTNHYFSAMNLFFTIFSTALLTDTRPLSHPKNLQKREPLNIQNKPNFKEMVFNVNSFLLTTNNQSLSTRKAKYKPDTNPIQTHSNPIRKDKTIMSFHHKSQINDLKPAIICKSASEQPFQDRL
jgi:hypothetical protein